MAAAPHLFDDPIASPELALVDADLAAQLRADLATGDSFRPRDVPRAEQPKLVFDAVVRDLTVEEAEVPVDDALQVEDEAELVDELVADDDPLAQPVPEVLQQPEEQTFELPEYLVVADDDVVRDHAVEPDLAEVELAELSEDVPPADEPLSLSVLEELAPPAEEVVELPDYLVESAEDAGDPVDELPDYVVRPEVELVPALRESIVAPAEVPSVEDDVADIVLDGDVIHPEVVQASTDEMASHSDYPVLPDLEERSDALEETEAALRRIREQLVPPGESKRRPLLRRRFTVVAGLCLVATAGVAAADVQLGLAHGWLGF